MKKIKIIIFFILISSQLFSKGQAWRSLLMPGWGEIKLGHQNTGEKFMYADAGIWLSFFLINELKSSYYNTYRNYASSNADVNWNGKNDVFASHVGNFDSIDEYNIDGPWQFGPSFQLYDSSYNWNWCTGGNNGDGTCINDSDSNKRRKYDDWRYKSRNYEEIRDFTVAALLINRAISLFNVFRLQFSDRISSEFKQYDNDEFVLKIFYHF